jgi:hypothetical protein
MSADNGAFRQHAASSPRFFSKQGSNPMKTAQNRFFPRQACTIKIEHAFHGSKRYHPSIATNRSISGVYFESPKRVDPDDIVDIVVKKPLLPQGAMRPFTYYKARTIWCRGRSPRYGIGAQLLEAKPIVEAAKSYPIMYACDLCEKPNPCDLIVKNEASVFLCESCARHLDAIGDQRVKQCILSALIGNDYPREAVSL